MTVETTRRHCPICESEVEMPVDTVEGMAAAPKLIAEAVRAASGGAGDGWSASEIAAHLADIEVALGWRLRQVLSADEPELQPFDQNDWAAALRYGERDVEVALKAYAAQRAANVEILAGLSEEGWERRFRHPEFGPASLRTLVRHISDHDLAHLTQIQD
ncbi:MAG: DinB family protein [Chloroflexi bacterium]|nr:DinB family protein [Chloroflexota bacterium]